MGNAKQCDRCKQLYSLSTSSLLSFMAVEDSWRYSVSKDCHPYPEIKFDLCPECQRKLAEWMKGSEVD